MHYPYKRIPALAAPDTPQHPAENLDRYMYRDMSWRFRHVSLTPHGDELRRLQGMGPRKAAKLRRQTKRLYDRVVLGPDTLPAHLRGASGEMSPHWRRGHFRMLAHGLRLSLRKVMFISPTIVRADRLTIDELP